MKKAVLLAASAVPGIVFGYAVFVGILMGVKPVPIIAMPGERKVTPSARLPKREPATV